MQKNQFHDRIQRATQQLAQLQARELLATQRRETKAKEQAKREEARRRARVAELAFIAGGETLEDAELVGLLRLHLQNRSQLKQPATEIGRAWLLAASLGNEEAH
ncbi:MAG: hypothetical protein E6Q40_06770 [Cupriavidus sp.]|nr:MAG: hypothetical protein E6Q40_06770 [Cupriavidus sp.]